MRSRVTASAVPAARSDGLLIESVGDETVIYDTRSKEAHCLKPLAAIVFGCSDGRATVGEIAKHRRAATRRRRQRCRRRRCRGPAREPRPAPDPLVVRAGGGLVATNGRGVSRREMLRRVGFAGAAAAAGTSLVTSIVAPNAFAAVGDPGGLQRLRGEQGLRLEPLLPEQPASPATRAAARASNNSCHITGCTCSDSGATCVSRTPCAVRRGDTASATAPCALLERPGERVRPARPASLVLRPAATSSACAAPTTRRSSAGIGHGRRSTRRETAAGGRVRRRGRRQARRSSRLPARRCAGSASASGRPASRRWRCRSRSWPRPRRCSCSPWRSGAPPRRSCSWPPSRGHRERPGTRRRARLRLLRRARIPRPWVAGRWSATPRSRRRRCSSWSRGPAPRSRQAARRRPIALLLGVATCSLLALALHLRRERRRLQRGAHRGTEDRRRGAARPCGRRSGAELLGAWRKRRQGDPR